MTSPQKNAWKALFKKEYFQAAALEAARELQQKTPCRPEVALSSIFNQASTDAEYLLTLDEPNLKEWFRTFF